MLASHEYASWGTSIACPSRVRFIPVLQCSAHTCTWVVTVHVLMNIMYMWTCNNVCMYMYFTCVCTCTLHVYMYACVHLCKCNICVCIQWIEPNYLNVFPAWDSSPQLLVTPAQQLRPDLSSNVPSAVDDSAYSLYSALFTLDGWRWFMPTHNLMMGTSIHTWHVHLHMYTCNTCVKHVSNCRQNNLKGQTVCLL